MFFLVPCSSGNYYNKDSGECELCLIGQYQPDEGQTFCLTCPQDLPVTNGPGAILSSECKRRKIFLKI